MSSVGDLLIGYKFDSSTLTYSTDSTYSKWNGRDNTTSSYLFTSKDDLSAEWKASTNAIVSLWSAYTALSFTEETNGADANLYLYRSNVSGQAGGTAWFDSVAAGVEYDGIIDGGYARSEMVFDNSAIAGYNNSPGSQYYILLHEIGHSLGLKGDVQISGSHAFTTDMSVMSYNIPGSGYSENNGIYSYTTFSDGRFAATPMAYDIAAMQTLYGSASVNAENGNSYSTTNGWFTGAKRSITILDTDGDNDTFDLSGYTASGVSIDLRQTLGPNDEWWNLHSTVGEEYIFIARGTVIENALGTSFNDNIAGNASNNILEGGAGLDSYYFYGVIGNDTINDSDGQGKLIIDGKEYAGKAEKVAVDVWNLSNLILTKSGDDIVVTKSGDGANSITISDMAANGGALGISLSQQNVVVLKSEDYYGPDPIPDSGITFREYTGTAESEVIVIDSGAWLITPSGGADTYIINPNLSLTREQIVFASFNAGADAADDIIMFGDRQLHVSSVDATPSNGTGFYLQGNNTELQFGYDNGNPVSLTLYSTDSINIGPSHFAWPHRIEAPTSGYDLIGTGSTIDFSTPFIRLESNEDAFASITGGDGDDEISGNAGNDFLYGESGNDTLEGASGDDYLYSGDGDDSVSGGVGRDSIVGGSGAGNDTYDGGDDTDTIIYSSATSPVYVYLNSGYATGANIGTDYLYGIENAVGGSGNDYLQGTNETNSLKGGNGNDYLEALSGNDYLLGEGGNDTLDAWYGDDTLYGGDGFDTLYASFGNDYADGGAGNDFIEGWDGNDSLYGGDGADSMRGNSGYDYMEGGSGNDTLDGAQENDTIRGGLGNDTIYGYTGNDTLYGEDGSDWISCWDGSDLAYGGESSDSLYGDAGNDSLYGEGGSDYIEGGYGFDYIEGGAGYDVLYGNFNNDIIFGGSENDYIDGGSENDQLFGETGDDTVVGGTGYDTLYGGDGNDSLNGQNEDDYIVGGANNDIIIGGLGNDSLDGGHDQDTLYGGDGQDTIWGWTGDDVLYGDSGNDSMLGGSGNDFMAGGDNDDYVSGGDGNDTLNGEAGNDDLRGGNDADVVTGGAGQDAMQGDAGSDLFVFLSLGDSLKNSDDRIRDFMHGEDTIVLSGLGFTGIQAGAGSSTVLGYTYNSTTNRTYVSDGADFRFFLDGNHNLDSTDFQFV